jgi:hypothetical protein
MQHVCAYVLLAGPFIVIPPAGVTHADAAPDRPQQEGKAIFTGLATVLFSHSLQDPSLLCHPLVSPTLMPDLTGRACWWQPDAVH